MNPRKTASTDPTTDYVRRHLRIGWWSLLFYLTLGIGLEAMHGLKLGFYLDVSNDVRRLMWTLAHAHGVLLALVHIAFAFSIRELGEDSWKWRPLTSACLTGAGLLLPGGFLLGGMFIYGGDPGLGIVLVPIGALLLFVGVLRAALAMSSRSA
jgi:hypothetical protein